MTKISSRRVAVTGVGVICSLGASAAEFWAGCLEGRSIVSPIPSHWRRYADYQSSIWSPLPDIDYAALGVSRVDRLQHDPASLLALGAAREAVTQAGLEISPVDKTTRYTIRGIDADRAGVFMGTGIGGAHTFLENHAYHVLARPKKRLAELAERGEDSASAVTEVLEDLVLPPRFHPFAVSMLMPNAMSATLGVKFSLRGPNATYCVACASGTVAIGHAFRAIRSGELDLTLAGGSAYLDDHYGSIFRGFDAAHTLVRDCEDPERANRPFDKKRSGFLFGQGGAAVLVLEELAAARRRGASIIAEIAGYGETFDAHSMMAIASDGAQIERMTRLALEDAQMSPGDIGYISAHGTSTQLNDAIECEVIGRVFGKKPLVNSTKSLLGHTIGASGALEAAVTALSLQHQTAHVCKNLDDPIADLNFVRAPMKFDIPAAFSQSFAFGGHNAGLVLKAVS
jgi:3-oxoacyl-[acyl-carrier-protein] synthase II